MSAENKMLKEIKEELKNGKTSHIHGSEDLIVSRWQLSIYMQLKLNMSQNVLRFSPTFAFSSVTCLWNWCTFCLCPQARGLPLAPLQKSNH